MKNLRPAILASAIALAALLPSAPGAAFASTPPQVAAVLQQEARWLTAIVKGDRKTIASILSPNYKHITVHAELLDRAQELAGTTKEPFTMNPTEETVDFAGNAAVVHGLNTISQYGKVLALVRFTDVFVQQNGTWLALSAQETATDLSPR